MRFWLIEFLIDNLNITRHFVLKFPFKYLSDISAFCSEPSLNTFQPSGVVEASINSVTTIQCQTNFMFPDGLYVHEVLCLSSGQFNNTETSCESNRVYIFCFYIE